MDREFTSFKEFYPFYLSQHENRVCRHLHYVGSIFVICVLVASIVLNNYTLLWLMPIVGYGFAWVGHLFFEKNKPATFKYPLYSFIGDWVMLWDWLTRKKV
ncbi:DUF962 domain-containing protein [Shewanella sp. 202IG2-18]|uniref:DUF962 domain-containing protein n=1 Tax=Parashewanella hymeniacidonis TaxID=2807618 RepID=UPI00195FDDE8|nr:DUF962 domain-containing protein [Parashewanella hymeniacidonis]